jgi:hypothetical protein
MKRGSILGRIVKEVSLSNHADDTPLTSKVDHTLKQAIPGDVYGWFMGEIAPPPLSGSQGLRLLGWLFKNIVKAELNLQHIKMIRQARREEFIEIVRENLPTVATMAHVTKEHIVSYNIPDEVKEYLVPYLSKILKRDVETIMVAMQWALKAKSISEDDCLWMIRYCKPVSEYQQLLLI